MNDTLKIFKGANCSVVTYDANNYAKRNNLEISHASLVCEEYCYYLTVVYRKKAECVQVDRSGTIHAKWNISCDGYYPYCSNCKEEPQGREMTKWCPNCGAKMDLKE